MSFEHAQVLYVEDQKAVAGLIQLELQQSNIRVTTVPNGEQCLALAREQRFDLFLLDAMLPDMDGFEVCSLLKSDPALHEVPVMFFSAYPSPAFEREASRIGATDFLHKGIHSSRLAARILAEVELARDRATHPSPRQPPNQDGGAPPPRKGN